MIVEVANWDLGGARVLAPDCDPNKPESYKLPDLDQIIEELRTEHRAGAPKKSKLPPAILTLQGVESSADYNQAEQIARKLGYKNMRHLPLGPSPYRPNANIGIALLTHSNFPLWFPETRRLGESQGLISAKVPVTFKDRLIIATAVIKPTTELTPDLLRALQLDPRLHPILIQGKIILPVVEAPKSVNNPHPLMQVPMPHQNRASNHNSDQVFYRQIELVPSSPVQHRPTLGNAPTWSKLVVNQFALPDEPEPKSQTPSEARPIFLYGDHLRPNRTPQNS